MLQVSQQVDTATTSKEAQSIMNLNLRLQSTAAKMQNKAIDIELKKLEATQLSEHLRIVQVSYFFCLGRTSSYIQAYLPDPYTETEADSTSLYLTFLRLSSKTDIITSTISQIHNIPSALHADDPALSPLVGICELRGKLRDFSNLNKRFAAILTRCQADEWIGYGKVLGELGGVEARVDGWIGTIRQDEFNEKDCARDLARYVTAHLFSDKS
jgi:dynactin 1